MFIRLLQLDDLMISYTNTCPETGLFVRLCAFTEVFAVAIEMPWTDGKPYIAGPRREPRRALDGNDNLDGAVSKSRISSPGDRPSIVSFKSAISNCTPVCRWRTKGESAMMQLQWNIAPNRRRF